MPATPSPAPLPPSLAIPTLAPTAASPSAAPLPPTPTPLPPTPTPSAPPASPPDIAFTQITAGNQHACALRQDATIACWGNNSDRQATPPQGSFTEIAAGQRFTCGLRQDAAIACWGDNSAGQAAPPQGAFTEIAAGASNACAVPLPQSAPPELLCWGALFPNGAQSLPLDAPLSHIRLGGGAACGITPQADMACLRLSQPRRPLEITRGPFTRLGVGSHHVCALRPDGSAFCQGNDDHRQASPPPTKFAHIAAGRYHSCGITQARALECWGSGRPGAPGERLAAPDGEFAAIAIGRRNSCALRINRRAVCWGTPAYLPTPNNLPVGISQAFGGAKFDAPVDIFPLPSGSLAVVERNGIITARHDRPDAPPPQTILDLTRAVICCQGESGMLSAALDPQFHEFPFLYVWYSAAAHDASDEMPDLVGRLSRFRVENAAALKNSELTILEVPQPNRYHLGGAIRFGADGMLYLGIGENASASAAQALDTLLGKIIRIDVRGANPQRPYRIPPDNPFADAPNARPEIWAYGIRNPWRMAFDPKNPARLFVADVGEYAREEVSIATAGSNLGWPLCEGDLCREWVDPADLAPPAVAYGRDLGCAIIGGVTVPWLNNGFIFSDLCSRRIWLLERDNPPADAPDNLPADTRDGAQPWQMREIASLSASARSIIAFGATPDGSVYALPLNGPILRLDPTFADSLPDE